MRISTFATATAALIVGGMVSAQACNLSAVRDGKHFGSAKMPATMFAKNNANAPVAVSIVGMWSVVHNDPGGNPIFSSLEQWHSDGTEFEFADIPAVTGDICMGVWTGVGRVYQLWHTGWTFDSDGAPNGTMVLTATSKLSKDGNSFKGPFDIKFNDMAGNQVGEISGNSMGERLSVPPSSVPH